MRMKRVVVAWLMTLREIVRRRIVILLLLVVPAFFLGLTAFTASRALVNVTLSSIQEDMILPVSAREASLVFVGLASVSLLNAFIGMALSQKDFGAQRRLILCGYHTWEIICGRLAALGLIIPANSLVVASMLLPLFPSERPILLVLGLMGCGWVYGCYGLLVGSAVRRELEGTLLVVLLVNVDAAWLQNPVYYSEARHAQFIRYLPAYFPSQIGLVGAFASDAMPKIGIVVTLLYGSGLLVVTLILYHIRAKAALNSGRIETLASEG